MGTEATAPWSVEQVLALAPDDAARTAARRAAGPAGWTGAGRHGRALWGECRGSGRTPYRVVVDVGPGSGDGGGGVATTCTCPSRKLPCKHALALLLLWATGAVPGRTEEDTPPYAAAWLTGRAERAARPPRASRAAAGTSPATAARRAARVQAGLEELQRWLADQVRTGVAGAGADAYQRFDPVAARMVDAQAPGVAATLRRLPQVVGLGGDWPARLLGELAGLHLLARAHDRLDELPDGVAATVRARVGYTVPTGTVLAGDGVPDRWQVLAVEESEQGGLVTRRTWLWGETTDRPALVLAFGAGGQPPDASFRAGTVVEGPAHFYPGEPPLRAVLGDRVVVDRLTWVAASRRPRTVDRLVDEAAAALAADPWTSAWPGLLEARPGGSGSEGWALVDAAGRSLPVAGRSWGELASWRRLLAVSGGAPVTAAVELVAGAVRVLGAWPLVVGSGAPEAPGASEALAASAEETGRGERRDSAGWRELVAAATVGAGTRPLPTAGFHPSVAPLVDDVDPSDPATALLDLAALERAAAAASPRTGAATPLPPAAAETSPVAGPRLVEVLLEAFRLDRGLAVDLLDRAVAAGVVAPPGSAATLVDLAQHLGGAAALVARLGGARVRWLGSVDPLCEAVALAPDTAAEGVDPRSDAPWLGTGPQRERWLLAARGADPDAARAALERTWAQETPTDRARWVRALATGLGPGDEAFLEAALDDRRRDVREAAAPLLLRLAGLVAREGGATGAGERAAARTTPYVVLGSSGLLRRPVLRVDAPTGPEQVEARVPGLARDGVGSPPPTGWPGGPRAWLLHRLVVATPLPVWEQVLGETPERLLALPREGELAPVLDLAWATAAVEQGDAGWARALLGARPDAPVALVAVLPPSERGEPLTALLAGAAARHTPVPPEAVEVLEPVPAPWPRELAAAVRAVVEGGGDRDGRLLALTARRVRADDDEEAQHWVGWARRVLAQQPAPAVRRGLERLGQVLVLRGALERELALADRPDPQERQDRVGQDVGGRDGEAG